MINFLTPLLPEYTIDIPASIPALAIWVVWFGLILFLTFRKSKQDLKFTKLKLIWLASLSALILILTPFGGFLPEFADSTPILNPPIQYLMLFVAVPWFLAAGMIGLLPAVVLGGISGLFLAYLDTHNIFTPLIFMSLALIFGWCIRQRYRTISFRILRFPLFAALMSICLVSPLIFIASVLSVSGNIITKITFAIDGFLPILLAAAGIVFFAGMISVIVGIIFNKSWGVHTSLQPAPGERSILFRYLSTTIPSLSGLLIILLVLNWGIGEKLARRSVIEEMTLTSDFAEDALTLAIETSTNLVKDIGNEATVITGNPETVAALFATQLANTPFVDHLVLVDMEGRVIARFPDEDGFDSSLIPNRDLTGLENVPQIFTLPSGQTNQTARIGFAYDVNNAEGETTRILWGETVLMNNPLTQSAINVLTRFSDKGGYAQIVDQQGAILFSTNSTQMMPSFREMVYDTSTFIEDTTADGTSTITYFQPLDSAGLAVIVSSPAIIIQEFTLESSLPFVFVGLTLMIGLLIFGLIVLVPLQKDIHQVSTAAEKIRFGNFDFNLSKSYSQGTAGQMVAKMDSMAETLRKRNYNPMDFAISFEELDVNAQLTSALHPVMQAAIMHGASNVRIILLNDLGKLDEDRSWARFGLGEQVKSFSALDHIIVAGAKRYEPTILIDSQIEKSMHLKGNIPTPKSIIAMPLHWDREWLGNLWVTFHDRNKPSENDISLLKEYAEKASSIVIQVRNLRKTMIIKKQMEDLLELLPEAVIISDQNSRIVYHNEVAQAMFGFDQKSLKGTKLNHFLDDEVFQDVLERGKNKLQLEEVQMKTGQVLHIITTPLGFDAGIESQGTIIRDITEQKLQDSRKTEFVTTVSHELRSPLTLIHGYAKILRLTGNLNEQQDIYIRNIIDGIEEMQGLVQNLLDIGRLESDDSLEITRFSAQKLIQKIMQGMDAHAKQKNIQMQLNLPAEPILLEADATFLTQALKNLIENAIKFTNMGGDVIIGVRDNEENVTFSVKDNGIGIAPLDQRHIFEKFQLGSEKTVGKGQGSRLGLAIVKTIADHHRGKVWFESQLGKGSTFYFQIPRKSRVY